MGPRIRMYIRLPIRWSQPMWPNTCPMQRTQVSGSSRDAPYTLKTARLDAPPVTMFRICAITQTAAKPRITGALNEMPIRFFGVLYISPYISESSRV